ncbi:hypothetical protein Clacol_008968 [Clathrus columnatus]|uniref:Uncharacterized protein n=1 Tax=Clathrus columnatus TaxID=1419009 RepID=A0AAV5AJ85_9AGAM|nr:hypothetical protein Clacol_008968 [Clathrus columnatus]
MTRFFALKAIEKTIKTLGLDDQIDASVFLSELEQQMMKLGNLVPPPPPAGIYPACGSIAFARLYIDFNDMPKGKVRRVTASPEDIARRRRLRQLFAEGLKDSLRDGASKPKLPPYPSNYEHTSV